MKVPLRILLALAVPALLPLLILARPPEVPSGRMVDEVADALRQYQRESDPGRRAAWLKRLAPTHDPRVAVTLGQALADRALAVRVAATNGLVNHFLPALVAGGTEQHMEAAAKWWKANEADLRRRAGHFSR